MRAVRLLLPMVLGLLSGGCKDAGDREAGDSVPPPDDSAVEASVITVSAERPVLTADGRDAVQLTLRVMINGEPAPDGTPFELTTDLGELSELTELTEGVATARFTAGTWPGDATLEAKGWVIKGDGVLTINPPAARSTQLHLHGSFSEGDGTMLGHTLQAELLGVDVLWWTDHEHFYFDDGMPAVSGYDFNNGNLLKTMDIWPPGEKLTYGFTLDEESIATYTSVVSRENSADGTDGWGISFPGGQNGVVSWKLIARPGLNYRPLLSDVTLSFDLRSQWADSDGAVLSILVGLSNSVTDDQGVTVENVLRFRVGGPDPDPSDGVGEETVMITTVADEWQTYTVNVSDLVKTLYPTLGADQKAEFVKVEVRAAGAKGAFALDNFSWTMAHRGQDLLSVQREYLATLPYDVEHHVGHEMAMFDAQHVNVYGEGAPIYPYTQDATRDWAKAVGALREVGALTSWNHMFGWELDTATDEARAAAVERIATELIATDVYGCDIIEIGYRVRWGLLEDFLTVWDRLSLAGVLVTAVGVSDLHKERPWSTDRNNFVTWVHSPSTLEPDLMADLERGLVVFGDPTHFADTNVTAMLSAPDSQATMGQVVLGAEGPQRIWFTMSPPKPGYQARLIVDGEVAETWTLDSADEAFIETEIDPDAVSFVRMEVLSTAGEAVLFTNPIWFWGAQDLPLVPEERRPRP
ncbi:MAG: hypothetical protein IPO67_11645 [Deltaproteobacteria bacterium]|nr:hypothetical protein [Deltaproteobacteria bacterium]